LTVNFVNLKFWMDKKDIIEPLLLAEN